MAKQKQDVRCLFCRLVRPVPPLPTGQPQGVAPTTGQPRGVAPTIIIPAPLGGEGESLLRLTRKGLA